MSDFKIVTDRDELGYLGLEHDGDSILYEVESPAWLILLHYYNEGDIRPLPNWLGAILFFQMDDDEVEEYEDEDA